MYEYETRIRYSEVDENGRIRLLSLLNYLQDTSEFHGCAAGMTTEKYREMNRAWFITYWDIHIDSLPGEGQHVIAGTCPHESKGLFAKRNFWLKYGDNKGDVVGSGAAHSAENDSAAQPGQYILRADSVWFMVNIETMMPTKHTEEDIAPYGERHDYLELGVNTRKVALPAADSMKEIMRRPVTRDLLDRNHHVNNVKYISAAFDALLDSGEVDENYYPNHIRAEYKLAAESGDTFVISIAKEEGKILILMASEDGKDFCHLEFC